MYLFVIYSFFYQFNFIYSSTFYHYFFSLPSDFLVLELGTTGAAYRNSKSLF